MPEGRPPICQLILIALAQVRRSSVSRPTCAVNDGELERTTKNAANCNHNCNHRRSTSLGPTLATSGSGAVAAPSRRLPALMLSSSSCHCSSAQSCGGARVRGAHVSASCCGVSVVKVLAHHDSTSSLLLKSPSTTVTQYG
jgi:hypothetical protein